MKEKLLIQICCVNILLWCCVSNVESTTYCPVLDPDRSGTCEDRCNLQFDDCPYGQKCCSHGCGHSCQTPMSYKQELSALNVSIVFNISYSVANSDNSNFEEAIKTSVSSGHLRYFDFSIAKIDVTEISDHQGQVRVKMLITKGAKLYEDFFQDSGELRTYIKLGLLKVMFNNENIYPVRTMSDLKYIYKVADSNGGTIQRVTLSFILAALAAIFYLV